MNVLRKGVAVSYMYVHSTIRSRNSDIISYMRLSRCNPAAYVKNFGLLVCRSWNWQCSPFRRKIPGAVLIYVAIGIGASQDREICALRLLCGPPISGLRWVQRSRARTNRAPIDPESTRALTFFPNFVSLITPRSCTHRNALLNFSYPNRSPL